MLICSNSVKTSIKMINTKFTIISLKKYKSRLCLRGTGNKQINVICYHLVLEPPAFLRLSMVLVLCFTNRSFQSCLSLLCLKCDFWLLLDSLSQNEWGYLSLQSTGRSFFYKNKTSLINVEFQIAPWGYSTNPNPIFTHLYFY